MGIRIKAAGKGHGKMVAEGEMTIYKVAKQKRAILRMLRAYDGIEIDLSRVTEIDTAGLQLLVLLKREALTAGKEVRLVAHSPASLDALDRFNLAAYFGDPVLISSHEPILRG